MSRASVGWWFPVHGGHLVWRALGWGFRSGSNGSLATSAALGLLAAAISGSALLSTYSQWSDSTVGVANGAVEQALDPFHVPPFGFVEAVGFASPASLTHAQIELRIHAGATVDLHDLRVTVRTDNDLYRYDAGTTGVVAVQAVRDPDLSFLTNGTLNGGDLASFDIDLRPLEHPIGRATTFHVSFQSGLDPPLDVLLAVPVVLTPVVDLSATLA